jgi:hypothetical protein
MATNSPYNERIQIDISSNGTTTLATVGKYCDRNIDVNVNVPASGITPSGSKSITTNGTHDVTNYANAVVNVPTGITPAGSLNITTNGTHDVTNYANAVVNVAGGQATQFTNLYDPAIVVPKNNISGSSSSGVVITSDNFSNYIKVPYHHVAGEPVVLRMRGIGTVRDRMGCVALGADGETRVNHYQINSTTYFTQSYDEHGDAVITFKGNPVNLEWYYFAFNFQYIGINSGVTEAKEGPIITINEPIGNGGYAG